MAYSGTTIYGMTKEQFMKKTHHALVTLHDIYLDNDELEKFIETQLSEKTYYNGVAKKLPYRFESHDDFDEITVVGMSFTKFCNQTLEALKSIGFEYKPGMPSSFEHVAMIGDGSSIRPVKCLNDIEHAEEDVLYEVLQPLNFVEDGNHMSGEIIDASISVFCEKSENFLTAKITFYMHDLTSFIEIVREDTSNSTEQRIHDAKLKDIVSDMENLEFFNSDDTPESEESKEHFHEKIKLLVNSISANKALSEKLLN